MSFEEVMKELILPLIKKQWESEGKPGTFNGFVKKTFEEGMVRAEEDNKLRRVKSEVV